MFLTDLLSGKTIRDVDAEPSFAGRWQVTAPLKPVRVNGMVATTGSFVVPRADHAWTLKTDTEKLREGRFDQRSMPSAADVDALLQMDEIFAEKLKTVPSFTDWIKVSPLAPRLDDYIRMQPFDIALERDLSFLEAICTNPRATLNVQQDLVPTVRARRVAAGAIVRLAAHREDWERKTVLGIRPRRVLCMVSEDSVDIYENRLVARLVDHIVEYLRGRLGRLAGIRNMLTQVGDHMGGAASGHHWRRDRLYELWAHAVSNESSSEFVSQAEFRINSLFLRASALLDSPLYRGIPRGAFVGGLRRTNIIVNDSAYRRAALLWQRWAELRITRRRSDEQVYQRQQAVCAAMARYGYLVVVRAIEQLHFQQMNVGPRERSGTIELVGPISACSLTALIGSVFTLRVDQSLIRVVCLPASIDCGNAFETERALRQLASAAADADEQNVLCLHLPAAKGVLDVEMTEVPTTARFSYCPWEPGVLHGSKLACISISPWDIASVERVARYLRWQLWRGAMLAYPPRIHAAVEAKPTQMDWLGRTAVKDEWRVLRRPTSREISLATLCADAVRNAPTSARFAGGGKRQSAKVNAEEVGRMLAREIEKSHVQIDRLCKCPVCSTEKGELKSADGDAFNVSCFSCKSQWGVYRCQCGARFPVLKPNNLEKLLRDHSSYQIDLVDVLVGSDILALPFREESGKVGFVCPSCEHAGGD